MKRSKEKNTVMLQYYLQTFKFIVVGEVTPMAIQIY